MNRNTPLTPELLAPVAEVIHRSECLLAFGGNPCDCIEDVETGHLQAATLMAAYRDDPAVAAAFAQAASIDLLVQGFIEQVVGENPSAPIKASEQAAEFAVDPSLDNGADVVLAVLIDLAQRGHTYVELKSAVTAKARRNLARTWVRDEQGIFHHDPDTEESP